MSERKRKQRGLIILTGVLIISLIAGSAGFATGYWADARKRTALSAELIALKESVSDENIKNAEKIKKENDELSLRVTELEEQVASLSEENEMLKNAVKETEASNDDETQGLLDPVKKGGQDEEDSADDQQEAVRVSLVDKITKYVILIIVIILVLMGVGMIFFGRKEGGIDEEDELSYEEEKERDISGAPSPETEVVSGDTVRHERIDLFAEDELNTGACEEEKSDFDEINEPEDKKHADDVISGAHVPETLEELMMTGHGGDGK